MNSDERNANIRKTIKERRPGTTDEEVEKWNSYNSEKKEFKNWNDDIDWTLYKFRHLVKNAFAMQNTFVLILALLDGAPQPRPWTIFCENLALKTYAL